MMHKLSGIHPGHDPLDRRTHIEMRDPPKETMMTPEQFKALMILLTEKLEPVRRLAEMQLTMLRAQASEGEISARRFNEEQRAADDAAAAALEADRKASRAVHGDTGPQGPVTPAWEGAIYPDPYTGPQSPTGPQSIVPPPAV